MQDNSDELRTDRRQFKRRKSDGSSLVRALAKVAAAAAGIVFTAGFLMTVLGWRFTGNASDIQAQSIAIAATQKIDSAQTSAIDSLRLDNGDILFMTCAIYRKVYGDAPVPARCPRDR